MSTTGGSGFLCSYCGCWHNYSEEMCRDLTKQSHTMQPIPMMPYVPKVNIDRHVKDFDEKDAEIDRLTKQLNDLDRLVTETQDCGMKQYALDLQSENIKLKGNLHRAIEIAEKLFYAHDGYCLTELELLRHELQKMKEEKDE